MIENIKGNDELFLLVPFKSTDSKAETLLYNTHFYLRMCFQYCPRCELTSHISIIFSDRGYYVFRTKSGNIDQPSFIFHSYTISTRGLKKQKDTSKLGSQSHFQKSEHLCLCLDFSLMGHIRLIHFLDYFIFPILFFKD